MNNNIRIRDHKKAFKNLKDFKSNDLKINIDDYMYMYTRTYNDGHEYDEDVCLEMAKLLQAEIDDGSCQKYKDHYQAELDALPNEVCGRCNGNNRGNNKKKDCNPCDGTGERENWSKSYPFDVENVQRFANFLKECGGMCIC